MSEPGYTVNQDDYAVEEPTLTWEDECRQRFRIDDERWSKDQARLKRNEIWIKAGQMPMWFRYAVCILEPLGIWAIFFLLLRNK
jgi:hypothetical protein